MDFLSYVAEVSRGWDEPNARDMGRMKSYSYQWPYMGFLGVLLFLFLVGWRHHRHRVPIFQVFIEVSPPP